MADHDEQAEAPPSTPDYELAETLELTDPAEYRALFEETRQQIVSLLLERAATTSELAEVIGKPKGTIGHHLKVLEEAGLVHVVRTKRVRALEAKYYGRTARVFLFRHEHEAVGMPQRLLAEAAAEIAQLPAIDEHEVDDGVHGPMTANRRYVRIPPERAMEWAHRMNELMVEFSRESTAGDTTYALVFGLYPTSRPALPGLTREAGEPS